MRSGETLSWKSYNSSPWEAEAEKSQALPPSAAPSVRDIWRRQLAAGQENLQQTHCAAAGNLAPTFYNCKETEFCGLSHPISSISLQWPEVTNIGLKKYFNCVLGMH